LVQTSSRMSSSMLTRSSPPPYPLQPSLRATGGSNRRNHLCHQTLLVALILVHTFVFVRDLWKHRRCPPLAVPRRRQPENPSPSVSSPSPPLWSVRSRSCG
jgi:hypothetical protein